MNIRIKYLLIGLGFGLLFPITSIVIDCCIFHDGSFSFSELGSYFLRNPIHYIVATAPIFLGLAFYIAGIHAHKQNQTVNELSRVNKNLHEANESLDSFNYHVSHDLKTVLSNAESLTLMLQKYIEKDNKEKVNEILSRLLNISRNGKETVQSFLAFGRATAIIYNENQEKLDVKEEILKIVDTHFNENELKVSLLNKSYSTLKIDKKALESIILNLLTNSIKYNDHDTALVKIELLQTRKEKLLVYEDNGIGIDMKLNGDKLFKPFEKIKNHSNAEGTGVGLYLVKKIVKAYNGNITIKSVLNEGTTFIIQFPKEM